MSIFFKGIYIVIIVLYVGTCRGLQAQGSPCILPPQQDLYGTFTEDTEEGTVLFNFNVDLDSPLALLSLTPDSSRDAEYLELWYSGTTDNANVTITLNKSLDLNLLNPKPVQPPDTTESLRCNFTDPPPYDLADKERIIYRIKCAGMVSDVIVSIDPVNNYSPLFHCPPYYKTLSEFTPVSGMVFTLRNLAYDPDYLGGINGYIIEDSGPFEIRGGASAGVVTLRHPLDYDFGPKEYTINVTVIDSIDPARRNSTLLYIQVADEDDLNPVFTHDVYTLTLPEEDDTILGVEQTCDSPIEAFDQDYGINATIGYRIIRGGTVDGEEYFRMNSTSGNLIPVHVLDRELIPLFTLTVEAYQVDNPISRTARANVVVTVSDINDHQPIMSEPAYEVTIQEGLLEGSYVFQVSAFDMDKGNNSIFEYRLIGSPEVFSIDAHSGVILVRDRSLLDRETATAFYIQVYAEEVLTMEGYSSNSSGVTVTLVDVNDNSPQCQPSVAYFTVDSPLALNQTLGWVNASDSDLGENGLVTFIMMHTSSSSVGVEVDQQSGRLYTQQDAVIWQDIVITAVIQAQDHAPIASDRRSTACVAEINIIASTTTLEPETTREPTTTDIIRSSAVTSSNTNPSISPDMTFKNHDLTDSTESLGETTSAYNNHTSPSSLNDKTLVFTTQPGEDRTDHSDQSTVSQFTMKMTAPVSLTTSEIKNSVSTLFPSKTSRHSSAKMSPVTTEIPTSTSFTSKMATGNTIQSSPMTTVHTVSTVSPGNPPEIPTTRGDALASSSKGSTSSNGLLSTTQATQDTHTTTSQSPPASTHSPHTLETTNQQTPVTDQPSTDIPCEGAEEDASDDTLLWVCIGVLAALVIGLSIGLGVVVQKTNVIQEKERRAKIAHIFYENIDAGEDKETSKSVGTDDTLVLRESEEITETLELSDEDATMT